MDKFLNNAKEFFNSNAGKIVLGVFATVIAGVITAKILKNKE